MSSSSSPTSPNDPPPFPFLSRIKQLFSRALTALQPRLIAGLGRARSFWSAQHHEEPQIMTLDTYNLSMHRPRYVLISMVPANSNEDLPLYYSAIDIDQLQRQQKSLASSGPGLGKTFMNLTFQAGIGLMALSLQAKDDHLHVVGFVMMIGFVASLIGVSLHRAYPLMGLFMEIMGSICATIGFFMMMSMLLPSKFMWIGWLVCALSLLAYLVAFKHSYQNRTGPAGRTGEENLSTPNLS